MRNVRVARLFRDPGNGAVRRDQQRTRLADPELRQVFNDGRRYSARDVALLREVQRLSQEHGVNLAGIKRIIELEATVDVLRQRVAQLAAELDHAHAELAARNTVGGALVVWKPPRRR